MKALKLGSKMRVVDLAPRESWYEFRAFNAQAIYGYGTADEADRYSDLLNAGRETAHYAAYVIPAAQAAEMKLEERDDVFSLSIALADAEEGQ